MASSQPTRKNLLNRHPPPPTPPLLESPPRSRFRLRGSLRSPLPLRLQDPHSHVLMGKLHTLRVEDCCLPALELPLDDSIAAAPAVAVAVSVAVVVVVCVSVLFRGVS